MIKKVFLSLIVLELVLAGILLTVVSFHHRKVSDATPVNIIREID